MHLVCFSGRLERYAPCGLPFRWRRQCQAASRSTGPPHWPSRQTGDECARFLQYNTFAHSHYELKVKFRKKTMIILLIKVWTSGYTLFLSELYTFPREKYALTVNFNHVRLYNQSNLYSVAKNSAKQMATSFHHFLSKFSSLLNLALNLEFQCILGDSSRVITDK